MLESALLLLLHQDTAHGYTLKENLEQFGLGGVDPSIIYRALRDMEAQGWVESAWDEKETLGPPRRVYRLTALGHQVLCGWIQELQATREQIDYLLAVYHQHMKEESGEHH